MAEGRSSTRRKTVRAPAAARTALIVAGMHRSGTSALTRVLNLLGAAVARDIMPADQHNRRGYWETLAVSDFDDRLLGALDLAWNSWEAPARPARDLAGDEELRGAATAVIEAQYGNAPLVVMKDPRLCRLLPFWTEVLEGLGITVKVILAVRRPAEVAASLLRRNGTNPSIAQFLWLRHVLEAEAASRGHPRACIAYDALLGDWRGATRRLGSELAVAWPRRPAAAAPEIEAFLTPELRTQDAAAGLDGVTDFSPWVAETWALLSRWAERGIDPADIPRLDAIGAAMAEAEPNFAPVLRDYQARVQHMNEAYAAIHQQALANGALAEQLRIEKAQAAGRVAALEQALADAHEARRAAELLLAEAGKVIGRQHREHADLRRGIAALRGVPAAALG